MLSVANCRRWIGHLDRSGQDRGNQSIASRLLGISLPALSKRLKRLLS